MPRAMDPSSRPGTPRPGSQWPAGNVATDQNQYSMSPGSVDTPESKQYTCTTRPSGRSGERGSAQGHATRPPSNNKAVTSTIVGRERAERTGTADGDPHK